MTEAFEHLCKSHDDFSCKGSSSNYDGDGMADVAAKLTEKTHNNLSNMTTVDLPSTNNFGQQQHVGNWVEVVDGVDKSEAVCDYD